MDRKHIIHKVLVKLNEVNPQLNDDIIKSDNINVKPIEIIVDDILEESTYEVIKIAPLHLLPLKMFDTNNGANVSIDDNYIARITLPDNYFRFGYIKFPCWSRTVYDIYPDTSVEYAKQQNPYIRAGFIKPIVFIRENNSKFIECYTVLNDDNNKTNVDFRYVEKLLPESVSDELIPLLVNVTAKKVLISMLKYDIAVGLEKEILNMLNTLK